MAYDTVSSGTFNSGTSKTISHTCTGTNLVLIVACIGYSDTNLNYTLPTGITYNGVALTKIRSDARSGTSVYIQTSLWVLIAPATGANNCIITVGGVPTHGAVDIGIISLTGCAQSAQPNANNGGTFSAVKTITTTLTTTVDNCWLVDACGTWDYEWTCNATQTERWSLGGGTDQGSTKPVTTAGSVSANWTCANNDQGAHSVCAIAPLVSTSIKKVSGVAQASIKVAESVALASIKKMSGVSNVS